MAAALGLLRRTAKQRLSAQIDEAVSELAQAVIYQWQADVASRVGYPYPLPVPFAVPADADRIMDGWAAIRGRADRTPIPLAGTTWNPDEPLGTWVATRMAETYPSLAQIVEAPDGSANTLARELVTRRRVLVILDGLDEIAPENYGKALDKLSEAVQGNYRLVVTCRTAEYREIVKQADEGPLAKTADDRGVRLPP